MRVGVRLSPLTFCAGSNGNPDISSAQNGHRSRCLCTGVKYSPITPVFDRDIYVLHTLEAQQHIPPGQECLSSAGSSCYQVLPSISSVTVCPALGTGKVPPSWGCRCLGHAQVGEILCCRAHLHLCIRIACGATNTSGAAVSLVAFSKFLLGSDCWSCELFSDWGAWACCSSLDPAQNEKSAMGDR